MHHFRGIDNMPGWINDFVTLGSYQEVGGLSQKVGDCMSSVRILVVDDYQPFRRFICSTLEQRPGLQVIGEASDGLQGVQQSEELQPDLIILDLGLPKLNGIESARQMRKCSPASKILIVSQESSADIAHEAFHTGVLGYVVKAYAGSELLPAVELVLQGRQFISTGLLPSTEGASGSDGPRGTLSIVARKRQIARTP